MSTEDQLAKKLDIIAKLLYMQTRLKISELEAKLVKTNIQKRIYSVLDGTKTAKEIAAASQCTESLVWKTLPDWEAQGLIVGIGKGKAKKYVNIEKFGDVIDG